MIDKQVQYYSEELHGLGIEHAMLEHPQLISVEEVQKYLGYGMEDSAATLLMKADDGFIAIIRRGDTKLDNQKVKNYLKVASLRMATEEEFEKLTGVPSGAASVYIPNIPTYIDKKIFEKEYINAGSGSLLFTFRYKTEDLKKIPNIRMVDICIVKSDRPVSGYAIGKRILSGITPSGNASLHIGNYLGAVKQFKALARENDCFLFVADLHALTTVQDKKQLEKNVETLILNELALLGPSTSSGLNNITFFRQSDVVEHTELQSVLNNVTPLGLIKRAHAYKDKLEKEMHEEDINMGLFCYPILMAADILLYKPDFVPVGKDQKQHVEITRDIAGYFNTTYRTKTFPLPDPFIPDAVASVLGTDGKRKMSKTLGNIISIFEDEDVIKKQVMGCYTDPTRAHADDPGHVEGNMVFTYLNFFGDKKKVEELQGLYTQGKVADVEVKNYLFESLMTYFAPARARYQELKANPKLVKEILEKGTARAREVATATMKEVREAVGLVNHYSFNIKYQISNIKNKDQKDKNNLTDEGFISIDEFNKVELRVGKVVQAENVEKSEKLIRLTVDFGEDPSTPSTMLRTSSLRMTRVIFTGVRGYGYTPEDFTGRQFFFVTNLQPRKMMGEESQGMILAVDSSASSEQVSKPIFVSAEGLPLGSTIR